MPHITPYFFRQKNEYYRLDGPTMTNNAVESDSDDSDAVFDDSEPGDVSESPDRASAPFQLLFRGKLYFVYYIICDTHNFVAFRLTQDLRARCCEAHCYEFHSLDHGALGRIKLGDANRGECVVRRRTVTMGMWWGLTLLDCMRDDGYVRHSLYACLVSESTVECLKKTEGLCVLQMMGLKVGRS
jgi:hypothetical protein